MFIISKKIKSSFKNDKKGMTLIELLVVMAIITILSAITIFDYNSFRSAVSTQNLANDIALSIRKAQSYAIGVKGDSDSFSYGYGISFTFGAPSTNKIAGSNKSFIIFKDIAGLGKYNFPSSLNGDTCGSPSEANECQEILTIPGADKILQISYLKHGGSGQEISLKNGRFDIIFKRPNPDASFCYRASEGDNCTSQSHMSQSYLKIKVSNGLASPKEITRTITVWNTGQISVSSQ